MAQQETVQESSSGQEYKLHPLVLLNVSDHHVRAVAAKPDGAKQVQRVMGVLLGRQTGRKVDISNSFEVPYDLLDNGVVVIETEFLERRLSQYQEVFDGVEAVGWYSTGLTAGQDELDVHQKMMESIGGGVFLLLDPSMHNDQQQMAGAASGPGGQSPGLPVKLYEAELRVVQNDPSFIFVSAKYSIEMTEAERVGVVHVASQSQNTTNTATDKLCSHYSSMKAALTMLANRMEYIINYIKQMESGEVPFNDAISRELFKLLSTLPTLDDQQFVNDCQKDVTTSQLLVLLSALTCGTSQLYSTLTAHVMQLDQSKPSSTRMQM